MPLTPASLVALSFNCIGQRTIDSFVGHSQSFGPDWIALQQVFNPPPAFFTASLSSPLTSSQVSASKTTLTETPLLEVCSAKVGPRCFVLHQHFARGLGHHLCGSLHSDLNVDRIVTAIRRPRKQPVFRVFCPRPISPTQRFS